MHESPAAHVSSAIMCRGFGDAKLSCRPTPPAMTSEYIARLRGDLEPCWRAVRRRPSALMRRNAGKAPQFPGLASGFAPAKDLSSLLVRC
eukprot:scaffold1459_cov260-Pinguiococcus_pyrenoidosus.AAC.8